jgi:translation initiation factor 2B subunit (eIF-2B alpha/beta/delta family)
VLVETPVVTCFLRHRGEVLLLRRSGKVGSYRGKWGGVAGHVENDDPDQSALHEIAEETGLGGAVRQAARGEPFAVEDPDLGKRWIVHPYLFDAEGRDARLDWESVEGEWVSPTEILRRDAVPRLWTSYERVAPRLESLSSDREHGASYLSLRALEVIRDRAGVLAHEKKDAAEAVREIENLAREILAARPEMAVIENRIHRLMHSLGKGSSPETIERTAHRAIGEALDRDEEAARRGSALVSGKCVLTLSRSETVRAAVLGASPKPRMVVAESRPGGEGIEVAEDLAEHGVATALVTDAGMAAALESLPVQLVLVGADTVLASGAVVNKVGTRLAALAARERGLPVFALGATDKISSRPTATASLEASSSAALYAGRAPIDVRSPLFEVTPAALLDGLVTERGILRPEEVASVASELDALSRWTSE